MNTDTAEREEFEVIAKKLKMSLTRNANKLDEYAFGTQKAWQCWMISASRMQEQLTVALELLAEARQEMRLIRMKDCDAVYDPTLRTRMDIALSQLQPVQKVGG